MYSNNSIVVNNITDTSDVILEDTAELIRDYIKPAINISGILVNIFLMILLSNKKLEDKKYKNYKFLWCRTFSNLGVWLSFVDDYIFTERIFIEGVSSYEIALFGYIMRFVKIICLIASIYLDNLFILNRFYVICEKIFFFIKLSTKSILFILFGCSSTISLPYFYFFNIKESDGFFVISSDTKNPKLLLIFVVYAAFSHFFPTISLFILNLISIVKYKIVMKRKKHW